MKTNNFCIENNHRNPVIPETANPRASWPIATAFSEKYFSTYDEFNEILRLNKV